MHVAVSPCALGVIGLTRSIVASQCGLLRGVFTLCKMHISPRELDLVLFVLAVKMKRVTEINPKLTQWICVYFCVKLGWTKPQTISALNLVFGRDSLSDCRIRHWHQSFSNGRTRLVDLQHGSRGCSGCSAANVAAVRALIDTDRRLSLLAISSRTGIPSTTVHRIIRKDLGLKRKCACMVPKVLTPQLLCLRRDCSQSMLNIVCRNPNFLKRIVTMDEAWIYQYDPDIRSHNSVWLGPGEDCPEVAIRSRAVGKVLLVSFFDYQGLIHFELLRNTTVSSRVFVQILSRLSTALLHRRPHRNKLLHMDNAPAHKSRLTKLKLLFSGIRTVPHPPYEGVFTPGARCMLLYHDKLTPADLICALNGYCFD